MPSPRPPDPPSEEEFLASQHKPQQPLIIVKNADGTGYVKQYDTLAEAKAAYKLISTDGVAYLYPPATSSLAYKPLGFPAPISNTGSDETVTVGGQTIPQKGMEFSAAQNIGPSGVPDGSINCELINVTDARGDTYTACVLPVVYNTVNGTPVRTEYEVGTRGCWYPENFSLAVKGSFDGNAVSFKIKSLDFSGTVWAEYWNARIIVYFTRQLAVQSGNGNVKEIQTERGFPEEDVPYDIKVMPSTPWYDYVGNDVPMTYDNALFSSDSIILTSRAGLPVPNNGYAVTYKVSLDNTVYSGTWFPKIIFTNGGFGRTVKWLFEPQNPAQPVPPSCSITKQTIIDGLVVTVCANDDVTYPYTTTQECSPPATVTINDTEIAVGNNVKIGMMNTHSYFETGNITYGPCSGMVYVEAGYQIFEDTDFNYYSDGNGGYYQTEKNEPCPNSGSLLYMSDTPINVTINLVEYEVGTHYDMIRADGNCGSYQESSDSYLPYETYLTEDDTYTYYSDGAGDYYTTEKDGGGGGGGEEYPPAGTLLREEQIVESTLTECGSSVSLGSGDYAIYADGNGGENRVLTNNNYLPDNGEVLVNCGGLNYFSDGLGSFYTADDGSGGGGQCDSYGTYITGGTATIYGTIGNCGNVPIGDVSYDEFADGECGSYQTSTGESYITEGAVVGSCEGYYWLSDGAGGVYQGCQETGTLLDTYVSAPMEIDLGSAGIFPNGTQDYSVYADGMCGTYEQNDGTYPLGNGELFTEFEGYNYFSDGVGGYYTEPYEPPVCDPYGTYIGSGSGNIEAEIAECGIYVTVGSNNYDEFADGECGSYTSDTGSSYIMEGTIVGTCNGYDWLSDGNGGAYQGCMTYGNLISQSIGEPYELYIPEIDMTVPNGTYNFSTYADGNCSSYDSIDSINPLPYGDFFGSDGVYGFYSDGMGGYYAEPL